MHLDLVNREARNISRYGEVIVIFLDGYLNRFEQFGLGPEPVVERVSRLRSSLLKQSKCGARDFILNRLNLREQLVRGVEAEKSPSFRWAGRKSDGQSVLL